MKNFLIYKSSAGSGKTYTLVKEYLKLVLKNPGDFRHTLAITFTNKAADEMRQRVIERVIALSEDKDPVLKGILIQEGVTTDIQQNAKIVLNNILHDYSCFSITTIDSFFHRIIKSFARELTLHLGYNLEMEPDTVLVKIADDLLSEIGENEELTKYLEDYIFFSIDDDKGWKIDYRIKEIGKEIFKERYWERKNQNGKELADNRTKMKLFISEMFKIVSVFEKTMIDSALKAGEIMAKYGLDIKDFPYGKSGVMNYLLNKIKKNDYEPKSRVDEVYSNPKKWFPKVPHRNLHAAINEGLHELLIRVVDNYRNNLRKYNSAKELIKTIYILGIFKDLNEKLKVYRDENRTMLISDTNNFLREIILDEADSPFIYEKIGSQYKNYLIDEFQDTSNFQWYNLLPLIKNSLSEQNFSMIVGDVKQSIYRWRSGNMKLLLQKVEEDLSEFKEMTEERPLNDNRRSRKEIIRFNNNFFEKASDILTCRSDGENKYLIKESYKDISQSEAHSKDGGYINITFIPREKDSEIKPKEIALQKLLTTISELRNDGFALKDILILTRNNPDGNDTARLLLENDIRVISSESLLIINSPKVKLLVNLLKYIADNFNQMARTEILYNYLVYIKEKKIDYQLIFTDSKKKDGSLFQSELPAGFFREGTTRISSRLNNLTLYELIENLIIIFGLNKTSDAYLLRFMDSVLEFTHKNNSDIVSFISWWEENMMKVSIIVPEEEDAVRVMTIHKAKGLQSPVVLVPFANWEIDINGSRDLIWVSSEEEPFNSSSAFLIKAAKTLKNSYFEKDYSDECILSNIDNLNLAYVAFTRAIERLYIFCPENVGFNAYNAGRLVKEVIDSDKDLQSEQKTFGFYEIGAAEKFITPKLEFEIKLLKPGKFVDADYQRKVVIKPQSELLSNSDLEYSLERGKILHKALSYINKKEDTQTAISKLLNDGLITIDETEQMKDSLDELINITEISSWFSDIIEVKSEAEMLLPSGKVLRPDRVMIKDNKAIVVDYKSGKPHKSHSEQVNDYADALIKSGYTSVNKYILYINDKKLVKV